MPGATPTKAATYMFDVIANSSTLDGGDRARQPPLRELAVKGQERVLRWETTSDERATKAATMRSILLFAALSAAIPLAVTATPPERPGPDHIDIVDAIAPVYNGFAPALNGEEKIADKRGWVRINTKNFLMNEYQLPAPIIVAGHYSTRRIAFTSSGVLAILDLADPTLLAREQGIALAERARTAPRPAIDG